LLRLGLLLVLICDKTWAYFSCLLSVLKSGRRLELLNSVLTPCECHRTSSLLNRLISTLISFKGWSLDLSLGERSNKLIWFCEIPVMRCRFLNNWGLSYCILLTDDRWSAWSSVLVNSASNKRTLVHWGYHSCLWYRREGLLHYNWCRANISVILVILGNRGCCISNRSPDSYRLCLFNNGILNGGHRSMFQTIMNIMDRLSQYFWLVVSDPWITHVVYLLYHGALNLKWCANIFSNFYGRLCDILWVCGLNWFHLGRVLGEFCILDYWRSNASWLHNNVSIDKAGGRFL